MDDTTLKIAGKKFVDFVSTKISVIIVKVIGLYSGYITIWVIGAASERGGCFRWGNGVLHVIDKKMERWRPGQLMTGGQNLQRNSYSSFCYTSTRSKMIHHVKKAILS